MIEEIKTHPVLSNFIDEKCCENGVCVTIDKAIPKESYVIVKIDNYYNSLKLELTPPSIDCLIIRNCIPKGYGLTLVELKKGSSSKNFDFENIKQKFETTLFNFIQKRFRNELFVNYYEIKLFFVSNKEIYKRDMGLKMEVLINLKFKFNNRNLMIRPYMPNPTIKSCYT